MTHVYLAVHVFWFARAAALPVLLWAAFRRGIQHRFPMFVIYVGWSTLASLTLLGINYASFTTGNQYFVAFLVDSAVETGLSFAMIYEIFRLRIGQSPALNASAAVAFRWMTVFLLALALVLAWLSPARGEGHLIATYAVLQRTVRTLQCGLLVFLFFFFGYLRLPWRSQTFGIALGFAIRSGVGLAVMAIRSQIEPPGGRSPYADLLSLASMASYFASVVVWTGYVLVREDAPQPSGTPPPHDLGTWNKELRGFLEP